jgi:hypothetical protein
VLPSPNLREPELEGISLDEPRGAAIFMIMRNRAMCSGNESALFYVYRVLQTYEALAGGEKVMRAQLKKEYGQSFERLLKALRNGTSPVPPEVSTQDVDAALCLLKKLGRFEPELADYVPGTKGKKTINIGLQVNDSVRLIFAYDSLIFGGWTQKGLDGHRTVA